MRIIYLNLIDNYSLDIGNIGFYFLIIFWNLLNITFNVIIYYSKILSHQSLKYRLSIGAYFNYIFVNVPLVIGKKKAYYYLKSISGVFI